MPAEASPAAARAMGNSPMLGKDAGYYMDEASVYAAEMRKRQGRR